MGYNVAEYEKFIDMVSDSIIATIFYFLSNSSIISQKNIHSYLKMLLKYFSPF